MTPARLRRQLALGLLSISLIALQLALMQIFSISQWHHFAAMIISIALLGFGAAGTLLALGRSWILSRSTQLLPLLLFACALSMALTAGRAHLLFARFDSYLIPYEPLQSARLLAIILLLTLPFLLGALVIGILFVEQADQIGLTYFANLVGSGLGGLAGIAALAHFAPEQLAPVLALPTLAAGFLLLPKANWLRLAGSASGVGIALALAFPPDLPISQFKDLQKTLDLPGSRTIAIRNAPSGQIRAVASPALRFAPGLSLRYQGEVPRADALFHNGDGFGLVPTESFLDAARLLDHTPQGLPFALAAPSRVLVLYAGTGLAAAQALGHGAQEIVAVEPQRAALELLRRQYPQSAGALFARPEVTLSPEEPRNWLVDDRRRYDLILLPTIGSFGGGAGVFALHEQYSLTLEAFAEIWDHLDADGLFAVAVWMDYPPRASLRLAATLVELLDAKGIARPEAHLAAVRSWGAVSFCLKRSPLTAAEIANLRRFCAEHGFDPLLLPNLNEKERDHFNLLQDRSFFDLLDRIVAGKRQQLYRDYPFNLTPATDDRPFFSQFLRWQSLPHLAELYGQRALPMLELGTLVAIVTFALTAATAIGLILLPLLRLGWRRGQRLAIIGYFGSIGLGYMLVEIVLIHRFVLFLGHPVFAAATVICALLLGSGAGSACSDRLPARWTPPQRAAAGVTLLLALYALLLGPLLQLAMPLPTAGRMALALALLTPAGFLMGLPFPLGLRQVDRTEPAAVPWAWGINGCLSVIGTSLGTLLALQSGFVAVMTTAAAAYGCAILAGSGLSRGGRPKF